MPITPAHAGLILPLWIRRPDLLDGVALGVASVLPDFVDLALEAPTGSWDRNFAHSLLGLFTTVIPLGVLLVWTLDLALNREVRRLRALLSPDPGLQLPPAVMRRAVWVRRLGSRRFRGGRVLAAVVVGGLSHIVFDAVTHDHFDWLLPWARPEITPERLDGTWFEFRVRGMRNSVKLGIFGTSWVALSGIGTLLLLWAIAVAARRRTWR